MGTDEFCDFWVGEKLREDDDVPKIKLMRDFGVAFFSFLWSFLVEVDVDCDQDIHFMLYSLLILRRMDGSF